MEAGEKMKNLLLILAENLFWLFSEYTFQIVYSKFDPAFGGQGLIRLENPTLHIELISDREKAYLEFSPIEGWKDESTSFDILKEILTNDICDNSIITSEQIDFLKSNFEDILILFSRSNKGETLKKVKLLERKRAKRLFG